MTIIEFFFQRSDWIIPSTEITEEKKPFLAFRHATILIYQNLFIDFYKNWLLRNGDRVSHILRPIMAL